MSSIPSLQLNDGYHIPQFGLGTWKTPNEEAPALIRSALEMGYRHIDTAAAYNNEEGVGQGIAEAGIDRSELFVTTKLWNERQGFDETIKAFDESLAKLKLEYVDLYLIHWPCPQAGKFLDTWKAFLRLREEGRVRSVGVSNFRPSDLEEIILETGVTPAVNQIEVHPLLQQNEMREFNQKKGILTEAWSPLAQGGELLKNPLIQQIAQKHGKTPAQVILRWHIELGSIIFPKSTNPDRIRENADIFDFMLDGEDMSQIATLDAGKRLGPDPSTFG
ncbi:2,5-diketo-D-gluconate reductase A [Pseudomonas duriflava]|uniref:2,5-diketo-D-gluconate reductase A n=1 Tax=Pseudomonas duriflava TaxID=459528 RepID=A0A562QL79_9PSED|nr:aldo/keto reductase [Pseudomonas duriflava]TWI57507.1 2,5-diketo-D-gluconate reductase A [Pseudomonas duriflava]